MNSPFFSIIIPAYNVEKYISRCIDSILSQTYKDFELIIVDDGSTDSTGAICDSYTNDSRVRVFHIFNGGASKARNIGIKESNGSFIQFIDSDDYLIDENALIKIKPRIATYGNDVVLFGCNDVYIDSNKVIKSRGNYDLDIINRGIKKLSLDSLHLTSQFPGSAWIMCVSKSIITDYDITFPENITGEDIIWVIRILLACKSIGAINDVVYNYIIGRSGQVTSLSTIKGCEGMLRAVEFWLDYSDKAGYDAISKQLAHIYLVLLMHYSNLSIKDRQQLYNRIHNCSEILHSGVSKEKAFLYISKLFGFFCTGKLLQQAYKLMK